MTQTWSWNKLSNPLHLETLYKDDIQRSGNIFSNHPKTNVHYHKNTSSVFDIPEILATSTSKPISFFFDVCIMQAVYGDCRKFGRKQPPEQLSEEPKLFV